VECLVSRGWRLLLAADDAPGLHYCLAGTGGAGTCITVTVPASVAFENHRRWPWQRRQKSESRQSAGSFP
jgi:hypothetical protein